VDVDLLIRTRREELPKEDLRAVVDILEFVNRKPGQFQAHIEYDFHDHHDVTMNGVLAVDFERVWQDARLANVNGHSVMVMAPEDMLIAAAINSCRHRFFGLKWLCDIAETVERYPALDWGTLTSKARRYEANAILYTALSVTRTVLGCSPPPEVLAGLKVHPVRAAVIRRLINTVHHRMSLLECISQSRHRLFGRAFSWPLVLTYATYRVDQLGRKMREVHTDWRRPVEARFTPRARTGVN
jgi:hypothetical protein